MFRGPSIYDIAVKTLTSIKSQVRSQNDILSFRDMPYFVPAEIPTYLTKFDKTALAKCLEHQSKIGRARTMITRLLAKYPDLKSPMSTLCVAVTLCGIGQCQEQSNRAAMELVLNGCQTTINMISIEGKLHVLHDGPYNHAFIIIGNAHSLLGKGIDEFAKLNDSCILFDSFLNIVGKANQIQDLMKDYLATYEMKKISIHQAFTPNLQSMRELLTRASLMADEIRQNIDDIPAPAHITLAQTALLAYTETRDQLISSIKDSCKGLNGGDNIIKAFATSDSVAFRNACAFGTKEIIESIFIPRAIMKEFDLNGVSEKRKFTGLDWLEVNSNLSADEKTVIKEMMIAAGALTYAQIESANNKSNRLSK